MTFAEKLRELRDAKGLSEAKLADASGLPFGTVHVYAIGRRRPSFAAVVKLAKALGVTCEAFAECDDIAGEDEEEKKPEKPAPKKKGGKK
ncbi:helix-turn-helix domain-containing protein [Frigoriglobus tundricola]|uniref:HTH cro/C1-type domain-containing protein n=1 Tax=Frigoriglobus tundricola TaxID=2774151 RepID=A0A6M5YGG9_9BACT|nr:helix-turn-helix transcriptional regulator [Frigoriglobus tundricola]QJW93117.1 hypothetical protein FTUN_0620 [Frigoriglobus tundricola]